MKYKVGDRVRIKSIDWYNENKDEYGHIDCGSRFFFTEMSDWCGKIATIKEICKTNCYRLEEYNYEWTDEMIEGLVEEEEIEFTEEDKYWCDIMSESDPTTYVLPQGYQFKDENGNMTQEEKYLQWMEKFFCGEEGETCKEYVIEASNDGKLSCLWSVVPYGRLGMYVRNYMRFAHPEIDEDFPNYGDFEDYSWELIQKLVEKWKQ